MLRRIEDGRQFTERRPSGAAVVEHLVAALEAIGTFITPDVEGVDSAAARQVWDDDDRVDQLYDEVCRELFAGMAREPQTIEPATHLLWVAHDLERMADRATNIAERVIFLVTGGQVDDMKENPG